MYYWMRVYKSQLYLIQLCFLSKRLSKTKYFNSISKCVLVCLANLGSFGLGCILAWSSPALPRINQDECEEECDLTAVTQELARFVV